MSNHYPSARASILERRTYLRPLDEDGVEFETPAAMLDRVIGHQRFLWEGALQRALNETEEAELTELRGYMEARNISASGRVKWMGGTALVRERASGAFNCSFTKVESPADMVDVFWLLLQGCGVGFKPVTGLMEGFAPTVKNIEIVPSTRTEKGGAEDNVESFDKTTGVWTITVGDSAKAWAKALGKIMAGKYPATTIRIDLSELRPGGKRLKGYGWLSSGWEPLAKAFRKICEIMIERAGTLLTKVDMGDIVNWLGTVLSSRRSAQIWLMDDDDVELEDFVNAKIDRFTFRRADGSIWDVPADFDWSQPDAINRLDTLASLEGAKNRINREQSNNTILFWNKPDRQTIVDLLVSVLDSGDPGFYNAAEARRRAPEMQGCNPCAEILLPSKGFCNLMQVVWHRFNGDLPGLARAQYLAGRANYRQTCVSMKDGVLQLAWDDNQHLLRLCGVSPTGYVSWEGLNNPELLEMVAEAAIDGANSMADELGTPRPRRVTQVQPAGTSSKVLGLEGDEVHEGAHCSPSRFIFNNVNFPANDPLVDTLAEAGYEVRPNPVDPTGKLVRLPVAYPAAPFYERVEKEINGRTEWVEVNTESAVSQLERYRILMKHYVQHNCSITISFDETEIEEMADWFMENWDSYVGVSFLKRNDPTLTAKDLGFAYLPQEAISERMYEEYVSKLVPVDLSSDKSHELIDMGECSTGACPIR